MLTSLLLASTVLFVPGPTNTLLAVAGTSLGFRKAFRLIPAETLGYATSVSALIIISAALNYPLALQQGMRIACASVLLYAAFRLWHPALTALDHPPVTFQQLFLVTLFNPKAIFFAYILAPSFSAEIGFYNIFLFSILLCVMVAAALAWVVLGSTLGLRFPTFQAHARKVGAILTSLFSIFILLQKA